jgi:DNA polymerase (family 10)
MSIRKAIPAQIARAVAHKIVEELRPVCDRIEIVGSLRRGKNLVHDIDIVLLPKQTFVNPPFINEPDFEALLHRLVERASLTPVRGKDKMKCFIATKTEIPVDIYVATEEKWATLLLIRTGSKEHNIRLAQRANELGMKLRASGDGIVGVDAQLIRVKTEEDIFCLLQLRYLEPGDRN